MQAQPGPSWQGPGPSRPRCRGNRGGRGSRHHPVARRIDTTNNKVSKMAEIAGVQSSDLRHFVERHFVYSTLRLKFSSNGRRNVTLSNAPLGRNFSPGFGCQINHGEDAILESKKISNDQELIQLDPISCPQNQKGNN